jgi:hypothetical protein
MFVLVETVHREYQQSYVFLSLSDVSVAESEPANEQTVVL